MIKHPFAKSVSNLKIKNTVHSLLLGTAFLAGSFGFTTSAQSAPKAVTSIAPLHSITAHIMGELGTPEMIVSPLASPHNFAFKPSQAKMLEDGELVIWVGPELETFLEKPLETIATKATILELIDLPGLVLLKGNPHDHGDGHDKDHEEHGDHHDEENAEAKHDDHKDHDHDHDHGHESGHDPHIWLNTANAKIFATAIAAKLSEADEANKTIYQDNLRAFEVKLDQLKSEIASELDGLSDAPFLVYHDAYRYFENEFGLESSGVFAINPELKPGAKKLKDLAASLEEKKIRCIFAEPQFDTKPIALLTEEQPNLNVKIGELDPLGSKIALGPNHYFETMAAMADSFADCLK